MRRLVSCRVISSSVKPLLRPCSAGVGLSGLVGLTTPGLGETTRVTQSLQNHSILIPYNPLSLQLYLVGRVWTQIHPSLSSYLVRQLKLSYKRYNFKADEQKGVLCNSRNVGCQSLCLATYRPMDYAWSLQISIPGILTVFVLEWSETHTTLQIEDAKVVNLMEKNIGTFTSDTLSHLTTVEKKHIQIHRLQYHDI
jgi:hypothetical protein